MIYKRCFVFCAVLLAVFIGSLVSAQPPAASQSPLIYFSFDRTLQVNPIGVWRFNPATRQGRRLAAVPASQFIDDLQWSPDGQSISYSADGFGMMLMRADGTDSHALIPNAMFYSWAPDSQGVVYIDYDSDTRRYTMYSREIDDTVDHLRFRDVFWPMWSPDGTTLAYTDRGMVLNLFHKGTSTSIVDGIGDIHGTIERIQWSPDGTKLAFNVVELTPSDTRTDNIFLYTVDADGSHLTQVANDVRRPELDLLTLYVAWQPFDWSPDSTTLVYLSGFETSGLYTVRADGTERRTLVKGEVQANGQAVSGQFFEFQSMDWSPDGSLIVFSAKKYTSFDIYTIRPDGTDLRPLIATKADEVDPVWRPDVP